MNALVERTRGICRKVLLRNFLERFGSYSAVAAANRHRSRADVVHLISFPLTNTSVNPTRSTGQALFSSTGPCNSFGCSGLRRFLAALWAALSGHWLAKKERTDASFLTEPCTVRAVAVGFLRFARTASEAKINESKHFINHNQALIHLHYRARFGRETSLVQASELSVQVIFWGC